MSRATLILTHADVVEMAHQRCATLGLLQVAPQASGAGPLRRPGVQRRGRRFTLTLDPTGKAPPLEFEASDAPEAELARLEATLSWMAEDLYTLRVNGRVIEGFTAELSGAYESLDLLGAVGRAMHEPQRPREFVTSTLRALLSGGEFGWVAGWFAQSLEMADLAGWLLGFTSAGSLPPPLVAKLRRIAGEMGGRPQPVIIGSATEPGGQIVVHPLQREEGLMGLLMAGSKGGADPIVTSFDTGLVENVAGHVSSFLATAALYERQHATFLGTVHALTAAIDAKDRYTCGHSARVARLSAQLARRAGADEAFAELIHITGLVHDVGKIGVPESILRKTTRLTPEEFDQVKRHPRIGFDILKDIPALRETLPGVLHHHERFDGAGYPDGLGGARIPLQARMLALADTFDAMSSTRSYRPAMPRQHTLEEIARCAGTQFDPDLAPLFLDLDFGEYDRMVATSAQAA
jgi:HD-GYP domain-containing protein (c-di-GMP phosphodiesterase class II)